MTLRFDDALADELEAVADADGVTVSEAIRAAITAHIEARRQDPDFRGRVEAAMQKYSTILDRLN